MRYILQRAVPVLIVLIVAVAVYDLPIFYSRWRSGRNEARATQSVEAEGARRTIAMLGGDELKISQFYASPGAIRKGEHTLLCYGVNGAKSVRIEPPAEKLYPAVAHCLQVSPAVTTDYKLLAEDGSGHTVTQQLTVQVRRD
jgi:hypothetical protein